MTKGTAKLSCAVWGELKGKPAHMDCPVIVHCAHEGVEGSPARTKPLPIICECECRTCKRTWSEKGRPIMRDGTIVYDVDAR